MKKCKVANQQSDRAFKPGSKTCRGGNGAVHTAGSSVGCYVNCRPCGVCKNVHISDWHTTGQEQPVIRPYISGNKVSQNRLVQIVIVLVLRKLPEPFVHAAHAVLPRNQPGGFIASAKLSGQRWTKHFEIRFDAKCDFVARIMAFRVVCNQYIIGRITSTHKGRQVFGDDTAAQMQNHFRTMGVCKSIVTHQNITMCDNQPGGIPQA